MRITRLKLCLLTLMCTFAGCSQTGGVRPGAASNMRTVASVGDKPLPIVAGEPGSSLRAETDELDLPGSTGSRISGRVYDDRGKPVPNAKVRLAVSSSPGGKVVHDTTARDGAFTLRGLRAGLAYTVIAEYQGEDGIVTGRAQTKAPDGDVRISLQPREETGRGQASIRAARPGVEPISNVEPVDDQPPDDSRRGRARSTPKISSCRRLKRHRCPCDETCNYRERLPITRRRRSVGAGTRARLAPQVPRPKRAAQVIPATTRPRFPDQSATRPRPRLTMMARIRCRQHSNLARQVPNSRRCASPLIQPG